ncbi:energy transducer TonB [Crocinitomix algicola]|uniref:hypothetical protein n=1 Tax=Crocinitomix algicola TaxID=1740263 RepID=UPI0008732184|nr:hypothetical protein [Crocinitomix algicola]
MKFLALFKEEDHRKALYASLIFSMLMILFFLLVAFEQPDPPLVQEEIEVELPEVELDLGSQAKGGSTSTETPTTTQTPTNVEESAQAVESQEEESTYVPSGTGSSQTDNTQESAPEPDETFGFPGGGGDGTGTGNGTAFGQGDGVGGDGAGDTPGSGTYNPDRKVTKAPSFNANAQEEGDVALDIYVDENGKVIKTRYNQSKSNTGSQYLINLAEKAAKTMKYSPKPGKPSEYVGYKVFSFIKS